ncbi:MAG: hypothetical protein DRN96_03245 [Thermoproteota archaeon]|nr:MAG: hypothetical protein DRN96_03245 [Candidatus Korarchaeota archaeon]
MAMLSSERGRKRGIPVSEIIAIYGESWREKLAELDEALQKLGLRIVAVNGYKRVADWNALKPSTRLFLVLQASHGTSTLTLAELGALAIIAAHIIEAGGKISEDRAITILRKRHTYSTAKSIIDSLIREGYLVKSGGYLEIGGRLVAEVDLEKFFVDVLRESSILQ